MEAKSLLQLVETFTSVHQYDTRQARKGDIFMTHKNTFQ